MCPHLSRASRCVSFREHPGPITDTMLYQPWPTSVNIQCNYSPQSDLFQSDQIHQLAMLVLYATILYYNSLYPVIFQLAGVASFYKICPKPEEPALQTTVYYKGADSVSCDSQSDFESPTHPKCFTLNLTCNWINIPESLVGKNTS